MLPRAALYLRISKDSAQRGLGVERQRKALVDLCERKGWQVAHTYTDNDISASKRLARPEFDRLCGDIEIGLVDAVVSWDQDRLFRDPFEAEGFIRFCEGENMHRIATVADDIDISTGEGLMVWRIKIAVAAEETRKMSKRLRAKHLELAEKGLPSGGKRPYGFERDHITHNESEAELIREAYGRVLAGELRSHIVADWNERGVLSAEGKQWSVSTFKRMLANPRLAGYRTRQRQIIGDGAWEPIIDRDTWTAVQGVIAATSTTTAPRPRSYWLTGLLTCGRDQLSMCGRWHGGMGVRRYSCQCNRNGIDARHLEAMVFEKILTPLAESPLVHQAIADMESATVPVELEQEAGELRDRLAELDNAYWQERSIQRSTYDTQGAQLQSKLTTIERQIATYNTAPSPLTEGGLAGWDEWDVGRQNSVASYFIREVTIRKATKVGVFDGSRVSVQLALAFAQLPVPILGNR